MLSDFRMGVWAGRTLIMSVGELELQVDMNNIRLQLLI